MTTTEWRGEWWLPGHEKNALSGFLGCSEDGDFLLRLIGGFAPVSSTRDGSTNLADLNHDFNVVLGRCAGENFTLLDCTALQSSGGLFVDEITSQDVQPLQVIRGIHLTHANDAVFESTTLQIEHLLTWSRLSVFSIEREHEGNRWTGKQTVATTPRSALTAHHDGLDYALETKFHQFRFDDRPAANTRSVANREWAELTISSPTPTSLQRLTRPVKALMDLLTLASHAPAGVLSQSLTPASSAANRSTGDVVVLARQIYTPDQDEATGKRVHYLFTLEDLDFSDLLPRWLELWETAWLGCSLLFGLRYIPQGYTSSRLLTAATAAESIHRALNPTATTLDEHLFEAILEKVTGALSGDDIDSKRSRQFTRERLRNDLTFKARLSALAAIPDADAVNALVRGIPKWAKYVKDQRNGMAHGERERLDPDTAALVFDAGEVTIALLGLVLIARLGLPAAVQQRAAALPYITLIAHRFNSTL